MKRARGHQATKTRLLQSMQCLTESRREPANLDSWISESRVSERRVERRRALFELI